MIEKLRMLTLEKIKFINKDIEENIVLDNYVSVLELYKQKRLIVKLYKCIISCFKPKLYFSVSIKYIYIINMAIS